jgi:hypothetical protein
VRAEVFQVEEVLGDRDGQESLFGSKVGGNKSGKDSNGEARRGRLFGCPGREVCVRGLGSGG